MPQMGQLIGQRLEQRMSQSQIQSLDLLAMPAVELRERITEELAENPALERASRNSSASTQGIERQNKNIPVVGMQQRTEPQKKALQRDTVFYSQRAPSSEASDAFQSFLENIPAPQYQSLQEHLAEQLFLKPLDSVTASFAERIIENLTADGFNAMPVAELFKAELAQKGAAHKRFVQNKIRYALSIIRRLDPIGCATRDFKQSLRIQAKILFQEKADDDPIFAYTLDILEHHFSYLEKARPYSLARAVNTDTGITYKLTQENAADILALIASLNPFPGRMFSATAAPCDYIIPTAFIERNDTEFTVRMNDLEVPLLRISPELQDIARHTQDTAAKAYIKEHIQKARVFIGSLSQREKTIVSVLRKLVAVQEAFFLTGEKRQLVPFTQQQLADELNIHESTVSRAVAGKYLRCQWGTFEIQYFFTNALSKQPSHTESSGSPATKEGIKDCIKDLLTVQKTEAVRLSDQKIADLLQEKYGVSVARRTVAKYRKELDIGSSYDRSH